LQLYWILYLLLYYRRRRRRRTLMPRSKYHPVMHQAVTRLPMMPRPTMLRPLVPVLVPVPVPVVRQAVVRLVVLR
jgi:hypothetical protein